MKFTTVFTGCMLAAQLLRAQEQYPRGYFRNPLDIPITLAGNFAECRPNHFHTGLDLKTNERENLNVYAAADGYVSRVSISHSGYGNAVYITHPNGYTTLYGHLNDFFPALQQYVVSQQYAKETWNIDLNMNAGQFPVKKGQLIALSGTTGGSTGPHVHFEIRDSKTEHVLNAALFGFAINDNIPPVAGSIAVYREGSVYEQNAQLYPLKKGADGYSTLKPLTTTAGKI
ncbi:MAG: M23 family metallopeptidase, partial [Sphingobacteriales bacterium]